MKRVIIVGSPRSNGRSARLSEMLFEANIDERPEDELFLVPVSEIEVGFCIGCNACRQKSEVIFKDDDGNEVSEQRHRCIFDDDMQTLYDLLDEVDALTVVSPVYFSGAPAPMKCVLDRLQPYFWEYRENGPRLPKRPLELHVIGEGGDPYGYDALISEVRGPLALAGFGLERIYDWVGKISPDGEIEQEAEVREFAPKPASAEAAGVGEAADGAGAAKSDEVKAKPRPKLSFSEGGSAGAKGRPSGKTGKAGKSGKPGGRGAQKGGAQRQGAPASSKGKPGQGAKSQAGRSSAGGGPKSGQGKSKPRNKGKGERRG